MYIETETTPNPATLKFLPGEPVMASGTREFTNEDQAEASPLAAALFTLGDVTGVFFGRDFISVTAGEGADWSALKGQVVSVLLDHFVSGAPLFAGPDASGISVPAEDTDYGEDPADADIVIQIKELIEERVRPAVANDGGDIVYRGFRDGVVYLQMQGSLLGLPKLFGDAQAGDRGAAQALCPRGHRSPRCLIRHDRSACRCRARPAVP